MREGANGPIKIGHTTRLLTARLQAMRTNNARPLTIIATMAGDRLQEASLRARFTAFLIRGEWFEPAPELIDYIRENAARSPFLLPRNQ